MRLRGLPVYLSLIITTILLLGCSDSKLRQRVAAMDTETLESLSNQYPENSKTARVIADELSRRPRKATPSTPPSKTTVPLKKRQIADQDKHGLTEAQRKDVFLLIVEAEDRADTEAQQRYPLVPTDHLIVGQTLSLSQRTPLMPELDPSDPMAAIQRMKQLPPGSRISVLAVSKKHSTPWYQVRASSASGTPLGSGWINAIALHGQISFDPKKQLHKQADLISTLAKKYKAKIAAKHNLTEEQFREISVEGISENWPMP